MACIKIKIGKSKFSRNFDISTVPSPLKCKKKDDYSNIKKRNYVYEVKTLKY